MTTIEFITVLGFMVTVFSIGYHFGSNNQKRK